MRSTLTNDSALLRQEIQQFYGLQMQAIDNGDVDAWVGTFTADGVFASNGLPEPGRGHDALRHGARQAADHRAERGVVHRHLVADTVVGPGADDDHVTARSYVVVIETPRGGPPTVFASTVMEDRLIRVDGGWLVEHRQVLRDDLR